MQTRAEDAEEGRGCESGKDVVSLCEALKKWNALLSNSAPKVFPLPQCIRRGYALIFDSRCCALLTIVKLQSVLAIGTK